MKKSMAMYPSDISIHTGGAGSYMTETTPSLSVFNSGAENKYIFHFDTLQYSNNLPNVYEGSLGGESVIKLVENFQTTGVNHLFGSDRFQLDTALNLGDIVSYAPLSNSDIFQTFLMVASTLSCLLIIL